MTPSEDPYDETWGDVMDLEQFEIDLNARCVCGCMDGGRFHKIYRFENSYGASVVSNPLIEGFDVQGYQIMFLEFEGDDYEVVEVEGMGPKIMRADSWEHVLETLFKLSGIDR